MCRRVSYDDGSAQMWGDVNTANFVSPEGGDLLVRTTVNEINKLFSE